jgi:hypothetical protein
MYSTSAKRVYINLYESAQQKLAAAPFGYLTDVKKKRAKKKEKKNATTSTC